MVLDLLKFSHGVSGSVEGSEIYDCYLGWPTRRGMPIVEVYCTCPAFENWGPCKHLWALLLQSDEKAIGPGESWRTPRTLKELDEESYEQRMNDGIPEMCSIVDEEEDKCVDIDDPDESEGQSESEDSGEGRQVFRSKEHEDKAWAQRLSSLESWTPYRRDAWAGSWVPAFKLSYVLNETNSETTAEPLVWVLINLRKRNGDWGAARVFTQGAQVLPSEMEESDREILASLRGAGDGYVSTLSRTSGRHGYHIDSDISQRVIPLMAKTGRLHRARNSREIGPTLKWDEGEPWRLALEAKDDSGAETVLVTAKLVRSGQELDVEEPDVLWMTGFLLLGDTLCRFTPVSAFPTLREFRWRGSFRLPKTEKSRTLEVLSQLPGVTVDQLPNADELEVVAPAPHLLVERAVSHYAKNLLCTICMEYADERVDVFDAKEIVVTEGGGRTIRRDFEAEARALGQFLEHGGARKSREGPLPDLAVVAAGKLVGLATGLMAEGWTVEAEGVLFRRATGSKLSVSSGIDWFDLEGGLEFGDGQVGNLPELLRAAENGKNTVLLGDGSIGILPEKWLERWGLLELGGKTVDGALRFERHQGWLLDALLAEQENVRVDPDFAKIRRRLQSYQGIEAKQEPRGFKGELREYQRQALGWFEFLRTLGLGGCLADDMGLGKTVQVLALLESRRVTRRRRGGVDLPSLAVVPRSLIFNWIEEAKRFAPKLRVHDHTGIDREQRWAELDGVDLIMTTYGTLRRDIEWLGAQSFDYVILDEAQAIKNSSSQAAKASRLLNAHHRLALSGTPIENHLGELWSLFEFLNPGMLGASKKFQGFVRGTARDEQGGGEEFARLSRAMAPFFLRRTKEEVLKDLPKKTEQVIQCDLKGVERREYDKLRGFYHQSLSSKVDEVGLSKAKIHVLEALLRLRQSACHPGLIDKSRVGESSAKLETLLPMLQEICEGGHKALIFSQFTSLLSIVRQRLDDLGLTYEYLDGRTRKRQEKVERFQSDTNCPLFLISIKAGGNGLNLTAADYVFLLDPWWNPAVESQAIDRVHRIGRTKPVVAYRLISSDTVEEKVVELQEGKRALANAILGQGRVGLRDLSREDLEQLLS